MHSYMHQKSKAQDHLNMRRLKLREALDSCQLQDLGYRGYAFTWSNKRPGDANTKIRLDRGVANEEWRVKF